MNSTNTQTQSFVKGISRFPAMMLLALGMLCMTLNATAQFSGAGAGTELDPYLITNAAQLNEMRDSLTAHYKLTADIDLTTATGNSAGAYWNGGEGWEPIANDYANPFSGSLDGDGFKIIGMTINRPSQDVIGLFGYMSGQVTNLGIQDVDISGQKNIGGLTGRNQGGTITSCYSTGNVSGTSTNIGGLVGYSSGTIDNSYTTGSVSGDKQVGGLTGNSGNTITNSYTTASIFGTSDVGGLTGYNNSTITASYSMGDVSGTSDIGGLVGDGAQSPAVIAQEAYLAHRML